MVRARKQPVADIPSPGYGQGEELQQMQRETPLDQLATTDANPSPTPTPPQDPFALAAQFVQPTGVPPGAPTRRPDEAPTAGLAIGPGPGPEALRPNPRRNPAADILEQLGMSTGDTTLVARAARLRNQGS